MSTRSSISYLSKKPDTCTTVYCHNDGYLSGVGQELVSNYNSLEDAKDLIGGGDMSYVGGHYKDLKNEPWSQVKPAEEKLENLAHYHDFNYVFMYGNWYYVKYGGDAWRLVDEDALSSPQESFQEPGEGDPYQKMRLGNHRLDEIPLKGLNESKLVPESFKEFKKGRNLES